MHLHKNPEMSLISFQLSILLVFVIVAVAYAGQALPEETGKVRLRGKCNTTSECIGPDMECRTGMCKCILGYLPSANDSNVCTAAHIVQAHAGSDGKWSLGILSYIKITLLTTMAQFIYSSFVNGM
ncbi:uncharacterized protein LOC110842944 isoform X2 [Folsomia candida]|uniref:uncharacterized protein LOC110842944 isoform X2 n=1 Tax=Folsomia candida TaxID=158441 RepID=UPI000B8F51DA|nr:uncharacterized protein LOC110842944 isoform X2 [Folsomia candida]